jgi:serine phosphatase RsbU (regulator of sigma subunit)
LFFLANGLAILARLDNGRWKQTSFPQLSSTLSPRSVYAASDGSVWFGAYKPKEELGQYGGFLVFRKVDGQWKHTQYRPSEDAPYVPYAITQTADGTVWAGLVGLRQFDGTQWTQVVESSLPNTAWIQSLYADEAGSLWVGTRTHGIFHFDGKIWAQYTVGEGLPYNRIIDIEKDKNGLMWVSTPRGLARFDGQSWTSNILPDAMTGTLHFDQSGKLWIRNSKVTYTYRPEYDSPETWINFSTEEVPQPGNTLISWHALDAWKATPITELLYSYRLDGQDWSAYKRESKSTYFSLVDGNHTFEVRARDRDFNVDQTPASIQFNVLPPVWKQSWFVGGIFALFALLATSIWQTIRVFQRDRLLLNDAEKELSTAHDIQMSLMPAESPLIEGVELAGRCITANHVGGDFFQYFEKDGKLSVAMADVTGHAMDAAIPVVMFNGVLDKQMEVGGNIEGIFEGLNRSMHRNLDSRTFVCFTMAEIDAATRMCRISNGGCPYPYHYNASSGKIVELQLDAYPLGVRAETDYDVIEVQPQPGDYVVFCSDGIAETENEAGDQLGYELTQETVQAACVDGLSAEAAIDRILEEVASFSGSVPQGDDMTCVVVRFENVDKVN